MSKGKQPSGLPRLRFLDDRGREIPDPTPLEIPAGFKRPETLAEQVRRLVRSEQLQAAVMSQGFETFEESEDFEIDDDMFDPSSPYEEVFDPVLGRGITPKEFHDNQEVYRKRFMEAQEKAFRAMDRSEALRGRLRTDPGVQGVETPAPSSKGPRGQKTPPSDDAS